MWLTAKEVIEHYKVKKSTLYFWVSIKFIPCYRIGSITRFKKEELDEWFEKYKVEAIDIEEVAEKISGKLF